MMKRLAALALGLLPVAAQAQTTTCFARSYSEAHLAQHPAQRVARIAVGPGPAQDLLLVRVTLRDGRRLAGLAGCNARSGLGLCVMEGDAGDFSVRPRDGVNILIAPGADGMGFEDASGFVTFMPDRGDDRAFLLYPVGLSGCP